MWSLTGDDVGEGRPAPIESVGFDREPVPDEAGKVFGPVGVPVLDEPGHGSGVRAGDVKLGVGRPDFCRVFGGDADEFTGRVSVAMR